MPFAKVAEPAELLVDTYGNGQGPTMVWTTDAMDGMASLAPMDDPALPAALKTTLAMRARVDALLALRSNPQTAQLETCVDNGPVCDCSGQICPAVAAPLALDTAKVMAPRQKVILSTQPIHFAVENTAAQARFVYVFLIEADNSITLLTPQDAALPAGRLQMITFTVDSPGLKRFLVLATDDQHPINATVLEQGQGARDATSCASALEKLLCQAGSGDRDPATRRAGAWSAIVTTVNATQS
jgi:hypothetical protein